MKKLFLILSSVLAVGALQAQTLTVNNNTPCGGMPTGCDVQVNVYMDVVSPNTPDVLSTTSCPAMISSCTPSVPANMTRTFDLVHDTWYATTGGGTPITNFTGYIWSYVEIIFPCSPAYVVKISDLVNGQMTAAYFSMPHSIVAASVPCCGDRQIAWSSDQFGNVTININ